MENPCIATNCKYKNLDKNRPECLNCKLRIAYVRFLALGDTDGSILPASKEGGMEKEVITDDKKAPASYTKICKNCGAEKHLSCFEKNDRMKDGYINTCKQCRAAQAQERKLKNAKKQTTPPAPAPKQADQAVKLFDEAMDELGLETLDRSQSKAVIKTIYEDIEKTEMKPVGPAGASKTKASARSIPGKPMVFLDFSDYPELYKGLQEQATDDFRDVGNQILFMLKIELDKQGGRNAQR
jgi:hypothetical protein